MRQVQQNDESRIIVNRPDSALPGFPTVSRLTGRGPGHKGCPTSHQYCFFDDLSFTLLQPTPPAPPALSRDARREPFAPGHGKHFASHSPSSGTRLGMGRPNLKLLDRVPLNVHSSPSYATFRVNGLQCRSPKLCQTTLAARS